MSNLTRKVEDCYACNQDGLKGHITYAGQIKVVSPIGDEKRTQVEIEVESGGKFLLNGYFSVRIEIDGQSLIISTAAAKELGHALLEIAYQPEIDGAVPDDQ